MQILIVRHADAGDAEAFAKTGKRDTERPLTRKGRRQMRGAAKGLRVLVRRVNVIATSPLVRAAQTAKIIARRYKKADKEVIGALKPTATPESFVTWAAKHDKGVDVMMVVGHEPHLSALATWLITGGEGGVVEFRKSGAALIEFEGLPAKGEGKLVWLMGPKELASIG